MMLDLDNNNSKLKTDSIKRSIENANDWAALFCNQSGRYYDVLALRHPIWCPRSVWEEMSWLTSFMTKGEAKRVAIHSKMINLPSQSNLIPVHSAYGGLAIYKTCYLLKHDYSRGPEDSSWDNDHVILNRKIHGSGGKLFIDPQLINLGWNHHSLDFYKIYRFLILWMKRLTFTWHRITFRFEEGSKYKNS